MSHDDAPYASMPYGTGPIVGRRRRRATPAGGSPSCGAAFAAEAAGPYWLGEVESDRLLRGAPWSRPAVAGDRLAEGLGDPLPGYRTASRADRVERSLHRTAPGFAHVSLGERA